MEAQLSMDLDSIIAANKASRRSQQSSSNNKSGRGRGGGRSDRDRPAARNSGPAYNTRQQQPAVRAESITTGSTKISIANLDFGVTEEDLKELFGRTGRIKKVQLFYDRNGKSTGTGHVIYASKEDALAAIKRYNGVQLDGRKMQIEVVVAPTTLAASQPALRAPASSSRSQPANGSSGRGNRAPASGRASAPAASRGRGGRGGRGARPGADRERTPRAAPKTQEELDRELMEYMGAPAGGEAAAAGAGDAMQMD